MCRSLGNLKLKSQAKNIIMITSDEMRGDCQGFSGNPDVQTPHLDALAKSGCIFEQHYAPFPKCVPSRCSMHTGRYTHTDGLRTVMEDNTLASGTPTLAETLRTHGFETAFLGLNHVWRDEVFYGEGEHQNKKGRGVVDYTSFTQGDMANVLDQSRTYPEGVARMGGHIDALSHVDFNGLTQGSSSKFCDESRADQAVAYLRKIRDKSKPFFLQLNLGKPHPPYAIHEPWYSMYQPDEIEAFPSQLPRNAPLPLTAQRQYRLGNDISPKSCAEIQSVYYGMISFIDDLVGQVLQAVDDEGLRDDTLIIFTADHGDYAGQYGINEKFDASLQDCLLRVPFVMSGPGVEVGKRVTSLSEHVDIPATVLSHLNIQPQKDWVWHGHSLWKTMNGSENRVAVFADGGHEVAMRQRFNAPTLDADGRLSVGGKQLVYDKCPDAMSRCKMVRTQEWKLIIREIGGNELYHVSEDRFEMTNLYGERQYDSIVMELQHLLLQWCLRTDTDRPYLEKFGA
jgi:arylsulfatase A-like enzyme